MFVFKSVLQRAVNKQALRLVYETIVCVGGAVFADHINTEHLFGALANDQTHRRAYNKYSWSHGVDSSLPFAASPAKPRIYLIAEFVTIGNAAYSVSPFFFFTTPLFHAGSVNIVFLLTAESHDSIQLSVIAAFWVRFYGRLSFGDRKSLVVKTFYSD